MKQKKVILLGCTGSIGQHTREVVDSFPERLKFVGFSAHNNRDYLLELGKEYGVKALALSGEDYPEDAGGNSADGIPYTGRQGLLRMIEETEADLVVNGIAGNAGFRPSITALENGKDLALANKETIIIGGHFAGKVAEKNGRTIYPVDSEHSAIAHLLRGEMGKHISEIILTASGGAFRDYPLEKMYNVTPAEALQHPVWNMGRKVTIDSATLANKGLEVMEAYFLFDVPPEDIKVVIHPQSQIHSLIRTRDGVLYAQISKPNMIHPIQNALTYPEILPSSVEPLDLTTTALTFFPVDQRRYPMLPLAYQALKAGNAYPMAYNTANEIAANAFLKGQLSFMDISPVVEEILAKQWPGEPSTLEEVLSIQEEIEYCTGQVLTQGLVHSRTGS